jgi:hypothetical protein
MFENPMLSTWTKLLRLTWLVIGIFICVHTVLADEVRKKAAVDFVYTFDRYILRFRPIDYVSPPGSIRIDALIGRNFGWLNAYLYWKINNKNQNYWGLRLDSTFDIQERIRASFQTRGFIELNQDSPDHRYFIATINYRLDQKGRFRLGLMEYGIKEWGGIHSDVRGSGLHFSALSVLELSSVLRR